MGKASVKVKFFKKLLRDFLLGYEKATGATVHIKVKTMEVVRGFLDDVKQNHDEFMKCNKECLKYISIFKAVNFDNFIVDWSYLHGMYFASMEDEPPEELVMLSKANISNVNLSVGDSGNISGVDLNNIIGNPAIHKIANDLMPMIQKTLENKDASTLNIQEIMSSLMSGDNKAGGIDFSEVIAETTAKVKDGMKRGDFK